MYLSILVMILIFSSILINSQVRIIRDNDLEHNCHLYKVIKVPIMINDDVHHWMYWMAEDLKPSNIDYVMDMETQKDQKGSGKFMNGAFDSTAFNYAGAVKSCPSGWRLPSIKDWDTLMNVLTEQQRMAFFNVLKGSKEIKTDTLYGNIFRKEVLLNGGYYWSNSESEDTAWRIEVEENYYNISKGKSRFSDFLMVRCIKDEDE